MYIFALVVSFVVKCKTVFYILKINQLKMSNAIRWQIGGFGFQYHYKTKLTCTKAWLETIKHIQIQMRKASRSKYYHINRIINIVLRFAIMQPLNDISLR